MKGRNESSVKLDAYYKAIFKTILQYQDPITGLVSDHPSGHAWIRDNVYSVLGVWALSLSYRKLADHDEDRAKAYELEGSAIKCMKGLMQCMIRQRDKMERFKENFSKFDSIHAKFSCKTGLPVVGDGEWGHLQIDSISLYLLVLAEMTASGLQIVYSLDEVAFVQNLVFYVESAYCTPDYGIWERGDKSNTGILELNASSIGMAIAALEAMEELNLFGVHGGPSSLIHVMSDETRKCRAVLQSMLPRESLSKETDASLLTVVGYPAFAVQDPKLIDKTIQEILSKLGGKYGCKRFLRDGYRNPKEDSSRLHYEPWELRVFENIECQWPMFFCYLIINGYFTGDYEQADFFSKELEPLLVNTSAGLHLVPELYAVPQDNVEAELANPGSQDFEVHGRTPFMWAQSLYIIGRLLRDNFIACGELDPINRRLSSLSKPEVVVQVVVIAKDQKIKELLAQQGFNVQSLKEVTNIEVHPARVLSHLYSYLGRNEKLGLTGRKNRDVGILTTSKLYKIQDKIFAFTPQRFDFSRNYMDCDTALMVTTLEYGLNYLSTSWSASGRPTISLVMGENMLDQGKIPVSMLSALKKLKSGYINGTRVSMGTHEQFLCTTCITNLSFLNSVEDGNPDTLQPEVQRYLSQQLGRPVSSVFKLLGSKASHQVGSRRKISMRGSIRRSRSRNEEVLTSRRTSRQISGDNAMQTSVGESLVDEDDLQFDTFSTPQEREKLLSESPYSKNDVVQLVNMLAEAPSIEEQADILHYLVLCYGTRHKIHVSQLGKDIEIRDLLNTLYETACVKKSWAIVRQAAGFLGKRVEDLSKSVTDLLVRQKQVTVGMPPNREVIISGGVLKSRDLKFIIHNACSGDESASMLSQELLVYLSMFIQTEPELFHGMLRLRVGLIIQVMVSEVSRGLKIKDDDEASDELMSLSPYEMRNLLHHIMSGREFGITEVRSGYNIVSDSNRVSKKLAIEDDAKDTDSEDSDEIDRQGIWLRRRRLDGALNRVPVGFYTKIWLILENCRAISIQGRTLDTSLTQGMTSGEMKFALEVESVLNAVPEPEFRQLLVEALIILSEAVENRIVPFLDDNIHVEAIVHEANLTFLRDQAQMGGDATLCCAKDPIGGISGNKQCGSEGICRFFYDSAPSGGYGTMSYLVRAACVVLDKIPDDGYIECMPM